MGCGRKDVVGIKRQKRCGEKKKKKMRSKKEKQKINKIKIENRINL